MEGGESCLPRARQDGAEGGGGGARRTRVKFWFIKNYMSPQMRAFVPHMAERYGFDFEFVTYKWPSWLHKQTEKQRIIWAYKILFLDVLFPLDLKKVIFLVRPLRPLNLCFLRVHKSVNI